MKAAITLAELFAQEYGCRYGTGLADGWPPEYYAFRDSFEAVAAEAEARGRRLGLEEAAELLDGELLMEIPHPDETRFGVARRAVAAAANAIRAKLAAPEGEK